MKSALIKIYEERITEILGIFLIAFAFLLGASLYFEGTGLVGDFLIRGSRVTMGQGAYVLPFVLVFAGVRVIRLKGLKVTTRVVGFVILFLVFLVALHSVKVGVSPDFQLVLEGEGGGVIGGFLLHVLDMVVGEIGSYIILSAVGLIGFLLLTDLFLTSITEQIKERIEEWKSNFNSLLIKVKKKLGREVETEEESEADFDESEETEFEQDLEVVKPGQDIIEDEAVQLAIDVTEEKDKDDSLPVEREEDKTGYTLPPLSLLESGQSVDSAEVNQGQPELLEDTLAEFGVEAKVVKVSYGPTITRYEVEPAPGVKVSKISNLADDIALSLAASEVRIEAPIPGKSAIGIEVPNGEQVNVHLREILESSAFQRAESKVSVALGKDIAGEPVVADLVEMPHLLVAGATGSGKSVCINSIISSLLYKGKPDEVKLMLIDPKMVELTTYQQVPHLIAPVVTDAKKAAVALQWLVEEMEDRYELFAATGTKGIESYNRHLAEEENEEKMPYIVVIIDELSDLMMVSADEVEDAICRLAQMARAAGIHLIIATQRPSVDVITGVIKANIPSRISFAVSSQVDSRTILDTGGAEKLLGKGDMLFSPVGSQKMIRVQGAFISEKEVNELVEYVREQDEPEYEEEVAEIENKSIEIDTEDKDELYEDAVRLVVEERASISLLQRKFRIGYTRAARLIDTMEEEGIVGEHRGSKARKVLIDEEDLAEILGNKEQDEEQED
ncbi:DNA translocase FtsK 4TM domain-containing protein [Fuchsiella alkaliacetigena]|nr:DNA translocase FtsK 4TM domain-containing protein [Fuchsiella alkaliacetigena]